jgi:hypothetical protein
MIDAVDVLPALWPKSRRGAAVMAEARVMRLARAVLGLLLTAGLAGVPAAQAQSVADFYRGKTLTMLVGVAVGGECDLLARLSTNRILEPFRCGSRSEPAFN